MEREQYRETVPPQTVVPRPEDRVISGPSSAPGRLVTPAVGVEANIVSARDRVQWGPIAAGTATALAVLLVLAVLGVAIGASAFDPSTDRTDWLSSAGYWGGASVLIAFFAGGWIAARTAAVSGSFAATMNGLMAGTASLLVMIWLTTTGLTNTLGFLGNTIGDITDVITRTSTTVTEADRQAAFDNVKNAAWGTLIVLVLALSASALGGMLGRHDRQDLIERAI